ncbi:MAG: MFS transporter [Chloroflexota bacterium]|jgi:predicted MFS family arabinose efflux permease|nr:MFS transporter [Chloroflexota bacterium]
MKLHRRKINFHILLFTLSRTVVNTSYRMVYPFLPVFAQGLGVDPATLGMALSIRSFLGIFGPFLATVADTRDRKTGILLGMGLFTLGSGLVILWPVFWAFILGASLVLLGNGVFIPSINAYLGDHIPYGKRGRVLAITEVSWALAFIVGIPVVRGMMSTASWVRPFVFLTLIGFALFIILAWSLPRQNIMRSEGNTLWQNLSRILRTWPALAGLLAGILFTGANEVINLVFGLWIEGQFGLNFNALTVASVVIGLSELGGEGVTWLWLDAMGKRRMIWIFLGVNSLAALLLPLSAGSLGWAMAGLGAFYISFEIVLVSALTLMSEVVPAARATMIAATVAGFSLGRMLGDLIAPGLFGFSFWASCLSAVGLNVLASLLLTQVRLNRQGNAIEV